MYKLTDQNCVIIGSLNPAIIQPNWLAKQKVIPGGVQVSTLFNVEGNVAPTFEWDDYKWMVDPSRFQISVKPESSPEKISVFIRGIFSKLEHTPVAAIGHNFVYKVESFLPDINFLCKEEWAVGKQTKWGHLNKLRHELTTVLDDRTSLKIQVIKEEKQLVVNFNFHRDVADTNVLVGFSDQFGDNRKKSEKILDEILEEIKQ